jgi:23S rRNA (pseudouridine1915-N3)-methyltransferase
MRLVVLTVSSRQPQWVNDGWLEYAKRVRAPLKLELVELPLARRAASVPVDKAIEQEGERHLAAVPRDARLIALDERGEAWSTAELAERLRRWRETGAPVAFLIGGPDGLSARCVERADATWSLSRLTLPHGLVRVVVAEALYRAATVLEGHPYHRA